MLELPLTPYLRYELDGYRDNVAAGEEILIADRAWHPGLAELTDDFMLLDGDTEHASVVWYRYHGRSKIDDDDHGSSPRIWNGRCMARVAQRVASVMSRRPARCRAPMARLRMLAMTRGPEWVRAREWSSR